MHFKIIENSFLHYFLLLYWGGHGKCQYAHAIAYMEVRKPLWGVHSLLLMWVPATELRLPGFCEKCFHTESSHRHSFLNYYPIVLNKKLVKMYIVQGLQLP